MPSAAGLQTPRIAFQRIFAEIVAAVAGVVGDVEDWWALMGLRGSSVDHDGFVVLIGNVESVDEEIGYQVVLAGGFSSRSADTILVPCSGF